MLETAIVNVCLPCFADLGSCNLTVFGGERKHLVSVAFDSACFVNINMSGYCGENTLIRS